MTNFHFHLEIFSPLLEKGKVLHHRHNSHSDILSRHFEMSCLSALDTSQTTEK